jgi:hypothetical protein
MPLMAGRLAHAFMLCSPLRRGGGLAGPGQAAEVDRLLGLGATRADIGQGEVPWIVLADPEGGEFCVLTPR